MNFSFSLVKFRVFHILTMIKVRPSWTGILQCLFCFHSSPAWGTSSLPTPCGDRAADSRFPQLNFHWLTLSPRLQPCYCGDTNDCLPSCFHTFWHWDSCGWGPCWLSIRPGLEKRNGQAESKRDTVIFGCRPTLTFSKIVHANACQPVFVFNHISGIGVFFFIQDGKPHYVKMANFSQLGY